MIFSYGIGNVSAAGNVIYVNGSSGNDTWDGLTHGTAKLTIKNATGTVSTNGSIYIASGTYSGTGNTNININHNMTIIGAGKNSTIISGLDSSRIFSVSNGVTFNLKSLTITNGKSGFGAGILTQGNTNVDDCVFTKCTTSYQYLGGGSAICCSDSGTLNLSNTDFIYNNAKASSSGGGTVYTNGTLNMNNCNFIGNTAYSGACIYVFSGDQNIINCTFINSTATTAGGVLEIYSDSSNIIINFCSFLNNTATSVTLSNNIDNRMDNLLDVTSCWWGSNSGPTGITGIMSGSKNWIYMILSINPKNIKYGDTSYVTANFNNLYNNVTMTVESFDPTISHIPDGLIVNFKSDIGQITGQNTTQNGMATAAFSGTQLGTATINATSSNQTLTSNIIINPLSTKITGQDVSGKHGENINLNAVLNDENNNPLAGETITFKINGNTIGTATTDNTGTASFYYIIDDITGEYTLTESFSGDQGYLESTTTRTLTVNKTNTQIQVSNVTIKHETPANLTATLKDEYNKPIDGQIIIFSIDKKIVGTAVTNLNGTATFYYLPVNSGNFIISSYYQGNSIYSGISGFSDLNVTPFSNVYLTANNNKNLKVGDTFDITYKLGNNGPDNAQHVIVTFKIPNGLEFVNAAVDNGSWKFDQSTQTVTWTLNNVAVGDPYIYLTVKAIKNGSYIVNPQITSNTSINTSISTINIEIQQQPTTTTTTTQTVTQTAL